MFRSPPPFPRSPSRFAPKSVPFRVEVRRVLRRSPFHTGQRAGIAADLRLRLRGTAAMRGTRDPRNRDIDLATAGLLAAWVVHDLEELATMARESRATLAELPKWVPVPRALRDHGLSQAEVTVAIGAMGAVVAGAAASGWRSRGRSALFRGGVLAFGVHGVGHLASAAAARGYSTGAVTAGLVVLPYWWWTHRVLRDHGLSEHTGAAIPVALAGLPVTVGVHVLACALLGDRAVGRPQV